MIDMRVEFSDRKVLLVHHPHQFTHFTASLIALALPGIRGFFKTLVFADFGHQTGFFAGFGKAPKSALERFPFAYFDVSHKLEFSPFGKLWLSIIIRV